MPFIIKCWSHTIVDLHEQIPAINYFNNWKLDHFIIFTIDINIILFSQIMDLYRAKFNGQWTEKLKVANLCCMWPVIDYICVELQYKAQVIENQSTFVMHVVILLSTTIPVLSMLNITKVSVILKRGTPYIM